MTYQLEKTSDPLADMCREICDELGFGSKLEVQSMTKTNLFKRILSLPRHCVLSAYKKAYPTCKHESETNKKSARVLCDRMFASYFNNKEFLTNFWSKRKVLILVKPTDEFKDPRILLFNKEHNPKALTDEEFKQLDGIKYTDIQWDVKGIESCVLIDNKDPKLRFRKYQVQFHGYDKLSDTCSVFSCDLEEGANKAQQRELANKKFRLKYPKKKIPEPSVMKQKLAFAEILKSSDGENNQESIGIDIECDDEERCICDNYPICTTLNNSNMSNENN